LRSRLQIPWAWQQIETIGPRIVDPEPKFEFAPVEPSDRPLSELLNTLIRQQLSADRFLVRQKAWIEDGMVKGLGVAKVVWLQEKKTLRVRYQPTSEELASGEYPEFTEQELITSNRPHIIYVDPADFFWDPAATSEDDWRYVFHRTWLTLDELKSREKDGIYKSVAKVKQSDDESVGRGARETEEEAEARRTCKYPVYERWHIDGSVMVVSGDVVLRDDPNPFYHADIPFAIFRTQPTPRSLVGISEVEKIDHLQEAIWTRDNQRIDAVSLALNQVMILDPTISGVRQLTIGPNTKIYASNGQRVEQLKIDPNQAPAFDETEAYLGAMQQMTGASPMFAGVDTSQFGVNNNTATGASIMQEEANKRMAMKKLEFRIFESRVAKLMVQLNHQFLSPFELQRIVGSVHSNVDMPNPGEIPMFLDVIPQGMSESMSKSVERNEIMELVNMTAGNHLTPMPDGTIFSIKPFLEAAIKTYDRDPSGSFLDMGNVHPSVLSMAIPMPTQPGAPSPSQPSNVQG
jgi:hypothetical protein